MNPSVETQLRDKFGLDAVSGSLTDLAIILGSGISCDLPFVKTLTVPYADLIGFPKTHVQGHKGLITLGELSNGAKVLIFAGRFHLYEGHSPDTVQTIVKLIAALGIKNLLITNAAGGIDESLRVADLMLIEAVRNYQVPDDDDAERGFLNALTKPPLVIESSLSEFISSQDNIGRGTYAAVLGPNYETPTEIKLFKQQGCSSVGMSTYLELKLALELGLNVAAVSVITNSWSCSAAPSHHEVLENSSRAQAAINQLFEACLKAVYKI